MPKLQMSCIAIGLLHLIATTIAAPNAVPAPALLERQASPTLTTLSGSLSQTSATHSSTTTTSTTTSHSSSSSSNSSTSLASNVFYLGAFTGSDGGLYSVTSQSGAYVIDGKTLHVGDQFLIGNEYVSDASTGLFAAGQLVELTLTTSSDSSSSSSAATTTATTSASSAAAAAKTTSTTSSSKAAAMATNPADTSVAAAVAAVGGLVALLL